MKLTRLSFFFIVRQFAPCHPVMRLVLKECELEGKYRNANILKGRGGNDVQHDKEN